MKKAALFLIVIALFSLLLGCETVKYFEKDEMFMHQERKGPNWEKIAILPFTGIPAFQSFSEELFSFHMNKQERFAIIGPAQAEIELIKQGVELSKAEIKIEEAQKAGQILGVDAVIVGFITRKKGFEIRTVAGVSLIDIRTGKVVATSIQSAPIMITDSRHKVVKAATKRVANDMLSILHELAGET